MSKLVRLPQVLERVAFRKTKLWEMIKDGSFPSPIKLTDRITAWDSADVDQWVADQIATKMSSTSRKNYLTKRIEELQEQLKAVS